MALFVVRLLAHTSIRVTDDQPDLTAVELPAIQQEVPPELDGNSGEQLLPRGALLTPDPSIRPPREHDKYNYLKADDSLEVYWSGERARLSEPFSLQIGDWYWSRPQENEKDNLVIVAEFRAHTSYVEGTWPMQLVHYCIVSENDPERNHMRYIDINLRVAPGVFRRVTNTSLTIEEMRADGDCDPADYGIPEPAGGYTHVYPCNTRSDKYRQYFASECGT